MIKDKYSITEVSKMSGLTTRTIRNYLKDGFVHAVKENDKWVFTEDDFTDMISNIYVSPAIKAKNNAPIFDFVADHKKENNSVCMVIDRILNEEDTVQFISKVCSLQSAAGDVEMRFEKKEKNIRIILIGPEAEVKAMYLQL